MLDGDAAEQHIRVFSTFPPSTAVEHHAYLDDAIQIARWSEEAGFVGSLVYTDNSLLDPWVVSQAVIANTERLCPLIAVQPVYMHPYTVAKLVATIATLFGRRMYLNMVAGGFVNDLLALNDSTEHDARYERLVEYTTIVRQLLAGDGPTSLSGRWYTVKNLRLSPAMPPELLPGITVSGSSAAGMAAAVALDATAIQYPRPAGDYEGSHELQADDRGIRIGVIARPEAAQAWHVAHERFPGDRRGQITHRIAMETSDSVWHRQLSQLAAESVPNETAFWLHPFENYKTFCPYLVGGYESVARAIAEYLDLGFTTFVMDVPRERQDLLHIGIVFDRARELAAV
jgi:alkanesulfonate monooxygenase